MLDAEPGPALLSLLLVAILAVRIVALAVSNAELFFDEAQYWAWGQEPAFGYYTKPPLIAWIIGATTSLCGDTPFCVRLPSPLMHFATSFVIYAIAAKLHSRRVALLGGAALRDHAGHVDFGDADVDRRAAAAVLVDRPAGASSIMSSGRRSPRAWRSAWRSASASTPNTR